MAKLFMAVSIRKYNYLRRLSVLFKYVYTLYIVSAWVDSVINSHFKHKQQFILQYIYFYIFSYSFCRIKKKALL
jgi:hypothetical protein